jgi:uncharacterized protein with HEPN domain
MSRGVKILLEEILEAIALLEQYTAGLTLESFSEPGVFTTRIAAG